MSETKQYDNSNSGVIFKNKSKAEKANEGADTSKWADYQGTVNVRGEEFKISLWLKTSSKDGGKFFSVRIEEPFKKQAQAPAQPKMQQQAAAVYGKQPAQAPQKAQSFKKPQDEDDLPF